VGKQQVVPACSFFGADVVKGGTLSLSLICTLLLSLAATVGCHFDASVANNSAPSDDLQNPNPEGEVVGDCTPGDVPVCEADTLLECSEDGELLQFACALGCTSTGEAHCSFAVPRAPVTSDAIDLGVGSIDTAASGSLVFDTDSGQVSQADGTIVRPAGAGLDATSGIHFEIVSQANGPEIGVFTVASVLVQADDSLRAQGASAFAIVSASDVIINGVIDVDGGATACDSDSDTCAGPGGGNGGDGDGGDGQGPGAGQGGSDPGDGGETGGGGGGFATPGARGGNGLSQVNFQKRADGGAGGPAVDSELLVPLRGGGGGGGGAREGTAFSECNTSRDGGLGGGGGGALQLFSRTRIVIANDGAECGIRASGGGGGGAGCGAGGGGAGSGGALLLEAPSVGVQASCYLVANGGGGSGGHRSDTAEGGRISAAAQASEGKFFTSFPSGDGGNGCYLGTAPEAGGDSAYQAGGGGGGDGRIRLHTAQGNSFSFAGTIAPAASQGSVSVEATLSGGA
jgi:hypothetical protein